MLSLSKRQVTKLRKVAAYSSSLGNSPVHTPPLRSIDAQITSITDLTSLASKVYEWLGVARGLLSWALFRVDPNIT